MRVMASSVRLDSVRLWVCVCVREFELIIWQYAAGPVKFNIIVPSSCSNNASLSLYGFACVTVTDNVKLSDISIQNHRTDKTNRIIVVLLEFCTPQIRFELEISILCSLGSQSLGSLTKTISMIRVHCFTF